MRRLLFYWAWLPLALALLLGFWWLHKVPHPIADEIYHAHQIHLFTQGKFQLLHLLTVFPTYHFTIASIAEVVEWNSLASWRLISFTLASLAVWIFYRLAKQITPNPPHDAYLRTLQFLFLPILFPFFFLLYTDIWSLLFVLLAVQQALARLPLWSGLAALVAVALRQTNIVWLFMTWALLFLDPHQPGAIAPKKFFLKTWPFSLTTIAFAAFVYLHGGIALGDRQAHLLSLNLSNLYFFLLLTFFLFLPWHLQKIPAIYQQLQSQPSLLLKLAALFIIYLFTYSNLHPYNQIDYSFFLRNHLLIATTSHFLAKTLAFFPIAWCLLSLSLTPLQEKRLYLLYPFTFLALIPLPLIDQRYYLIPLTLFLSFRQPGHAQTELPTLLLYLILCFFFLEGIQSGKFFL